MKKLKTQGEAEKQAVVRRSALIEWLCSEYPIEEATEQIDEAEISDDNGIITVKYSNGVKNVVRITEKGVMQIF